MKKAIFSLVAFTFLAIFGVIQAPSILAEEKTDTEKSPIKIQISPVAKRLMLNPGEKNDGEFTVQNIGEKAFNFKLSASPYSMNDEDSGLNFSSETQFTQLSRWVTFDQSSYQLEAGGTQLVKYHIDVPEDVAGGGQYAVIFAEASSLDTATVGGVKATSRVGLVLYSRISGETREAADILEYSFPNYFLTFDAPKLTVSGKVKNTGNTDFEARYHLEVKPFFGGDPVFERDVKKLALPGATVAEKIVWDQTPLLGFFNVKYSVNLPGSASRSESKIVIFIPAWLALITLTLLTGIIIWITILIRKHKKIRSRLRL